MFLVSRLGVIWSDVCAVYKELGVPHSERISDSKFFNIKNSKKKFPCLSCKAAICKHLLPVMEVISRRRGSGSLKDRLRLTVLGELNKFIDTIEVAGHHLTSDQSNTVVNSVTEMLIAYVALATLAMNSRMKIWSVTPNFHYFYHLAQHSRWSNPRMGWVFKDEDYVGRLYF